MKRFLSGSRLNRKDHRRVQRGDRQLEGEARQVPHGLMSEVWMLILMTR